jgi:hypothetical protein
VAFKVADREAVAEADTAWTSHLQQRLAQGSEVGLVQAAAVDAAGTAGDDRDAGGDAQHDRVERLAGLFGVLLGVVEQREGADVARAKAVVIEEHGGRDQRAGQAAAPGLVGPGHEPHAQRTIVLEELAASTGLALLLARLGRLGRRHRRGQLGRERRADRLGRNGARGGRCAWVASRWRRRHR